MSKILKSNSLYIKVGKNSIKTSNINNLELSSNTNVFPYYISDIISNSDIAVASTNNGILYSTSSNNSIWQTYTNLNYINSVDSRNRINFKNLVYALGSPPYKYFFATSDFNGLYYSNNGISWSNAPSGTGIPDTCTTNKIFYTDIFNTHIVATDQGLYSIENMFDTLNMVSTSFTSINNSSFIDIVDNRFVSMNNNGEIINTDILLACTNNNIYYATALTGITSGNLQLSGNDYFLKLLVGNDIFLALTKNKIYSTSDGITYTPLNLNYNTPVSIIYTSAIYKNGICVIGTNKGILYSRNLIDVYYSNINVEYISNISYATDTFYAVSKTNGVFESSDGITWKNVGTISSHIDRGNFTAIYDTLLNTNNTNKLIVKTVGICDNIDINTSLPTAGTSTFSKEIIAEIDLNTNTLKFLDFFEISAGIKPEKIKYDTFTLNSRTREISSQSLTTYTSVSSVNQPTVFNYNRYNVGIENVYNIDYVYDSTGTVFRTTNILNKLLNTTNLNEELTNNEIAFLLDLNDIGNNYIKESYMPIRFNNTNAALLGDLIATDSIVKTMNAAGIKSDVQSVIQSITYNTFSLSAPDTSASFTYNTNNYANIVTDNLYNNIIGLSNSQPAAILDGYLSVDLQLVGDNNSYIDNMLTYNPNNKLTFNNAPAYIQGHLYNFSDTVKTFNTELYGSYDTVSKQCTENIDNINYQSYIINVHLPSISAFNFPYDYYKDNTYFMTNGVGTHLNNCVSSIINSANVGDLITGELYFNIVPDDSKLDLVEIESDVNYLKYNNSVIQHDLDVYFNETHKKMSASYNYNKQADLLIESTLKVITPLDMFYDLGFNYNRDVMYLDYVNNINTSNLISENTNSIFGQFGELRYDENNIIYMAYLKDTLHNFEVFPQSFSDYRHIGNVSNEYNIYGLYNKINNNTNTVNIAIFKYNNVDGLASRFYTVPVKYSEFTGGTDLHYKWVGTASQTKLTVGFMSLLPSNNPILGNFVGSNLDHTNGGKTYLDNIKDSLYDNTLTLIDFDISNKDILPDTAMTVRYVLKNTDVGYYPQYTGIEFGINKFWENPVIANETFYKLQLYTKASAYTIDEVYEHYNNDNYSDNASNELLSVGFSGNVDEYIYLTNSITNGGNSSIPMKWFRKYDLFDGVDINTGVDLSGGVSGDALSGYVFKTIGTSSSSYYPIDTSSTNTSANEFYSFMELDIGLTIQMRYSLNPDNTVQYLIFKCLNAVAPINTQEYIISNANPSVLLPYTSETLEKYYNVFIDTADDIQKLQFTIQRI